MCYLMHLGTLIYGFSHMQGCDQMQKLPYKPLRKTCRIKSIGKNIILKVLISIYTGSGMVSACVLMPLSTEKLNKFL